MVEIPKKKKPVKLTTITNRLDRLVSLIVRARDRSCVICGSRENLQCGHFVSRVFTNTRWNLENCNCQCASCNVKHELDAVPYLLFIELKYGKGTAEKLSRMAHETKKINRLERLELETHLKNVLSDLSGGN